MGTYHYWAIVWIIVAAFLAITVITILGLLKKVDLEPKYMAALFTNMVLGFVGAGFFIFYHFNPNQLNIYPDSTGLYAFNEFGEPQAFQIRQGDSTLYRFVLSDTAFKNIPRRAEKQGEHLYIRSEDGAYLGYVDLNRLDLDSPPALTTDMRLRLGLYYAQNKNSELGFGHSAVEYLTGVLNTSDSEPQQRLEATMALYRVVEYVRKPQDFKLLINSLQDIIGPSKYYEIAETFRLYWERTETFAIEKYSGALRNYIRYLIEDRTISSDTLSTSKKFMQMKANMKFFASKLNNRIPQFKAQDFNSSLDKLDMEKLRDLYALIPKPDLSKLDL